MKLVGSLQVTTPSEREVAMTRTFNAPRRLVFDAYTKPELVKRWAGGPPGWRIVSCEIDLRVGGVWHWVTEGPGGMRMGYGGTYLNIVAPERLDSTEVFDEPWYEGEATSSMQLEEAEGRTTLTVTVRYASQDIRDAVLRSPMAEGMASGFDSLEALLTQL